MGTGFVGLVVVAGLAELGNDVTCVALDDGTLALLLAGDLSVYEPGLAAMVRSNVEAGRVNFSTDLDAAVRSAEIVFLSVDVGVSPEGQADLTQLFAVAERVGKATDAYKVIVNKSTVPVGATERLKVRIAAHCVPRDTRTRGDAAFGVVYNPTFLTVGDAVNDFMKPDRVLIGTDDARAAEVLRRLYAPLVRTKGQILVSDVRSAELAKYAASALLASRISFVNELARLADHVGADMEMVRRALGADSRIGPKYLFVGPGFGGSQFQKDIAMLLASAREAGQDLTLVRAVHEVNLRQKQVLLEKVSRGLAGDLDGKTIAVWGLAFKPRTDDIGEAPALVLVDGLLGRGASVRVHDPRAMNNARALLGDRVTYAETMYDAVEGADALVLVTEWHPYRRPDFGRVLASMTGRLVVDGRNIWDPIELRELGFRYVGVGRS